jgi:hypothetical protein
VDHDKRIAQAWKKRAVYSVFVVALLVYPIDRAWNLVQDVVRLTDEWKHYVPPPPQAKQHSFFDDEHITKPTLANNE